MARSHGKDIRVYLGARDVSGDVMELNPAVSMDTHPATTFASDGWKESDPGVSAWEASISALYDGAAGGIGRQFEDLLGSGTAGLGVLSVYDGDADGVGDTGFLGSEAVLENRGQPITIADLVKLSGILRGNGRAGLFGKLLHPKGAEAATGNGTALDNSASSANGGRGNLHATAVTGTGGTVKIQHSTDNSVWTDLLTFAASAAAGSETKEVTGTVNRYLRVVHTINGSSSVTYVAGFARY